MVDHINTLGYGLGSFVLIWNKHLNRSWLVLAPRDIIEADR